MYSVHSTDNGAAQSGFILATSLVFLLIVTLLAMAGVRASAQLSRMATTERTRTQALETARSALRFAETRLASGDFCTSSARCRADTPIVKGVYHPPGRSSGHPEAHYRIELTGRAYTPNDAESGMVDLLFRITAQVHGDRPGQRATIQSINQQPGHCNPASRDTGSSNGTSPPAGQRIIERFSSNSEVGCQLLPPDDNMPIRGHSGRAGRLSWHESQA